MKLKELSLSDVEQARQWRNQQIEMLRTSFPLTKEQQEKFYHEEICNRQANARYWGIVYADELIGMCGIENIQWENRLGEISLVLNPDYAIDKCEEKALKLLLHEGFMNLNLENIYTEVYDCSSHIHFWKDMNVKLGESFVLPKRKYYSGQYWDSTYINFNKERYNENTVS